MSKAAAFVLPQLYAEGKFDVVISIGGGQNAKNVGNGNEDTAFCCAEDRSIFSGMWKQDHGAVCRRQRYFRYAYSS